MNDDSILTLLFQRDEAALSEIQEKYGHYCQYIAEQIVGSREDAEECVNDTWRRAWDTIPPQKPSRLAAYLGMLTRHLALDRIRERMREKRGGGQVPLVLDELLECVADTEADSEQDERLREALDTFLSNLPRRTRMVFVRRYWYTDAAATIAKDYGMSENSVNVLLFRTRKKLKQYLNSIGIDT
jgi:RNA polymerase sigma-70 factor (ECF subfamily)